MTKFETWVRGYGVQRLAAALRADGPDAEASASAIYQWIYGQTEPRSAKISAMVRISRGAITLADVYRHVNLGRARRGKRAIDDGVISGEAQIAQEKSAGAD